MSPVAFGDACDLLGRALNGPARREVMAALGADPLDGLRAAMRRNVFAAGGESVDVRRIVDSMDARSRKEGIHVMQGWDFTAHRFTDDTVPVLLLDYCRRLPQRRMSDARAAAVLLDQYFLSVLSLLTVRAWDDGEPGANLDRVGDLVRLLHGPDGCGHRWVDDAETLLFLAVSYFHPDEAFYDTLLEKVESLDTAHQLRVAAASGPMLGAHLRWGLRFMYRRDLGAMRNDNVADYPWLLHAVATLASEYARLRRAGGSPAERLAAAELLLASLSADPLAFTGTMPHVWAARATQYAAVRDLLETHGAALHEDLRALQPTSGSYFPLGFTCNFPTNASVAMVAVTVEDDESYPPINSLFRRDAGSAALTLAARLFRYSTSDASRLGAGGAPLLAYDAPDGVGAYNAVLRALA